MKLISLTFFLVGVCFVTPQSKKQQIHFYSSLLNVNNLINLGETIGLTGVVPALRHLNNEIENFKRSLDVLTKSINTAKCTPTPNRGGLHKMANSLNIVAKYAQQFVTDSNGSIDSSGNINGDITPVVNDVNKVASELKKLAKIIRTIAANRDYYNGDFKGARIGLENCAKGLHGIATAIGRLRGLSRVFIVTSVYLTQVNKAFSDLRKAAIKLIKSINRYRKKCGKIAVGLSSLTKGIADIKKALADLEDNF